MSIVVAGHVTQWPVLSEFLLFIREFDVGTSDIFFYRGFPTTRPYSGAGEPGGLVGESLQVGMRGRRDACRSQGKTAGGSNRHGSSVGSSVIVISQEDQGGPHRRSALRG